MISAVNAILECVTTGLFTAVFMLVFVRQGWFPIMIVQTMTQEEFDIREAQEQEPDDE
jgi:hypothetical protein